MMAVKAVQGDFFYCHILILNNFLSIWDRELCFLKWLSIAWYFSTYQKCVGTKSGLLTKDKSQNVIYCRTRYFRGHHILANCQFWTFCISCFHEFALIPLLSYWEICKNKMHAKISCPTVSRKSALIERKLF